MSSTPKPPEQYGAEPQGHETPSGVTHPKLLNKRPGSARLIKLSCAKRQPELPWQSERRHQQQFRSPDCLPCSGSDRTLGPEFLFTIAASLVRFDSERRPDNQRLSVPYRGIVGCRHDGHRHSLGLPGSGSCSNWADSTRSRLLSASRKS